MLVYNKGVLYFPLVLISTDIFNAGKIYLSLLAFIMSLFLLEKRGVLSAEYPSFEEKMIVDDLLKDQQVFEAVMVPKISVASKVGGSSSTSFPLSSLDVAVIKDLLEEEKLLGYKPKADVGEHVIHCM